MTECNSASLGPRLRSLNELSTTVVMDFIRADRDAGLRCPIKAMRIAQHRLLPLHHIPHCRADPGRHVAAKLPTAIISGHQWSSVAISGHQWPSAVISGHQWPSVAISGHRCAPMASGKRSHSGRPSAQGAAWRVRPRLRLRLRLRLIGLGL